MIVSVVKEVANQVVETVKNSWETGAKVTEKKLKTKGFNPDKRIDVKGRPNEEKPGKNFNPDKRIDINRVIDKKIKEYKADLERLVHYPDTLKLSDIKKTMMERVTGEKLGKMREDFKSCKDRLITEWESKTGKEWPRYENNVYNKNGILIHKAGDRYDAHHVLPLSLGGLNVWSNITPMDCLKHQEIHKSKSACMMLQNLIR